MGCTQSTDVVGGTWDVMEMEIGPRHNVKVFGSTKKNHYPKNPTKPNQDAFCKTSFKAPDGSKVDFFAVFDGHGEQGHKVAQFVAKNLSLATQKEFKNIDLTLGPMDKEAVEKACLDAHLACNHSLKTKGYDPSDGSKINSDMSGTTSISIVVWSGGVTVCNVGDSRAIIGEAYKGVDKITARALSRDQIPIRKDERDRVKTCGGCRVLTLAQAYGQAEINEEEDDKKWTDENAGTDERIYIEDPPRLFSPRGMYPGYQFTRAFGDFVGTSIGIIAEPEISTISLTVSTRMLVLATDGVFEYLTDQDVVDVCSVFPNPKDACDAVIELAHKNWIDKDVRADDITMICIYCNANDPLSMSTSIKGGVRPIEELPKASHEEKSGLPNFANLTAECVKEYIKTGQISKNDFTVGGAKILKSSESMIFENFNTETGAPDLDAAIAEDGLQSSLHCGVAPDDIKRMEEQAKQQAQQEQAKNPATPIQAIEA